MNAFIDIGNSNIVIGVGEDSVVSTYRYRTDVSKSSDEYYSLLKAHFENIDQVIISSVVPQVNGAFKTFLKRYFEIEPIFVGPGVKTGVKIKTENPKEVGADLVAGAAGALEAYGDNLIIIDMGTATTYIYVEDKTLKGAAITVGLDASKDCLVSKASKLLQFEFESPKNILGTNTIDALNSGLLFGHTFQIIGMVRNIQAAYKNDAIRVVVTGGAAKLIRDMLPESYDYDEHLVLKGLIAILKRNQKA